MKKLEKKSEFGSGRIARWIERLQNFNFKISYKKGTQLIGSDALIRWALFLEAEITEKDIEKIVM